MKLKIGFFVAAVFQLAFFGHALAQTYSDYTQGMIDWGGEPLTWSDIKRTSGSNDSLLYNFHYVAEPKPAVRELGRGTKRYEYLWNTNRLSPTDSWVTESRRDSAMLQYCRLSFDLWELYSRRAMIEYLQSENHLYSEIFEYYRRMFNHRVEDIFAETGKATDLALLDKHTAEVRKELEEATFDPVAYADMLSAHQGYYISGGLNVHVPFSDYVTTCYGFGLGAGYYYKNSMFGMDVDFGFGGKCTKDILQSRGTIYKDDQISTIALTLIYGQRAFVSTACELSPYFGLGVHSYMGGRKDYWEDNESKKVEKDGFSLGLGMMIDCKIRETVSIKSGYPFGSSTQRKAIRIKPYFSMTKYNGDMEWVPAINVAVEWNVSGFNLKK